jgi:hypothetical protein
MQKKKLKGILLFSLIIVLLISVFTSCEGGFVGFFTNSLGEGAARDMSKMDIKVTEKNVDSLIDQATGNPDMQAKILETLVDVVAKTEDPVQKKHLQEAGVDLAIKSTNVTDTVLSSASEIMDLIEESQDNEDVDPAGMVDYFTGVINDMGNLGKSTDDLMKILPNKEDFDGDDEAYTAAVKAFVGEEADGAVNNVMVSVLLVCAEAQEVTGDDDIGALLTRMMNEEEDPNLSEEEKVAMEEKLDVLAESPKIALAIELLDASKDGLADSPFEDLGKVLDDFNLRDLMNRNQE